MKLNLSTRAVQIKLQGSLKKSLYDISKLILDDCNRYCKEETGELIQSSYTASNLAEGKLKWDTPYARRQYWFIPTAKTDVNPNATWKWCEVARQNHRSEWIAYAQKLFKENMKK